IALLDRPDVALAAFVAAIVLARQVRSHRLGRAVAVGFGVGVAPMAIHLVLAGPGNAFRGMVLDPVFRLRPGRRLPVPPSAHVLDGFLQRVTELDVISWPQPFTVPIQLRTWFFVVVAATVLLVAAAVVTRRRGDAARVLRL